MSDVASRGLQRDDDDDENSDVLDDGEEEPGFSSVPSDVLPNVFGYLDVQTLLRLKEVSHLFHTCCQSALLAKAKPDAGRFHTKADLRSALQHFYTCRYVEYHPELAETIARDYGWVVGTWDVSHVTNFSFLFRFMPLFDQDISDWNVVNGIHFQGMFQGAEAFSSDLSGWNMHKAKDTSHMFQRAQSFRSDLSSWDVQNVIDMRFMFDGATMFDSDLSRWDLSSIQDGRLTGMLCGTLSFRQDVSSWLSWNMTVESKFQRVFGDTLQDISSNHPRWTKALEEEYRSVHGSKRELDISECKLS